MDSTRSNSERLAEMLGLSTAQHERKYNIGKILGIWTSTYRVPSRNEIVAWIGNYVSSDKKVIVNHPNYISTNDFDDNAEIHFSVPEEYEEEWKSIYSSFLEKKNKSVKPSMKTDNPTKKLAPTKIKYSKKIVQLSEEGEMTIELRPQRVKKDTKKTHNEEKKHFIDGDRDSQLCEPRKVDDEEPIEEELNDEYMMNEQFIFSEPDKLLINTAFMKAICGSTGGITTGSSCSEGETTGEWLTVDSKKKKTPTPEDQDA